MICITKIKYSKTFFSLIAIVIFLEQCTQLKLNHIYLIVLCIIFKSYKNLFKFYLTHPTTMPKFLPNGVVSKLHSFSSADKDKREV